MDHPVHDGGIMFAETQIDPLAHLRVLTMKQVTELTGYTPQHIYRLERAGKFPARIRMGENRVGWRLADYEQWFNARPTVQPLPADDND
jgi:prophage regulatory protein